MTVILPFRRRRATASSSGDELAREERRANSPRFWDKRGMRRRQSPAWLNFLVGASAFALLVTGIVGLIYFGFHGAIWLAAAQAAFLVLAVTVAAAAVRRARHEFMMPLRRLTDASRAIAAGTYDETVRARANDEIAELIETFNRMARAVQAKTTRLEALNEVALALTSSLSLEEILDRIMNHGIGLTHASAACIAFFDEITQSFANSVSLGLSQHFMEKMEFRPGGLADDVFRRGGYILASDRAGNRHQLSDLARAEGIRAFLCMPLLTKNKPLGLLYLYRSDRDEFDFDEIAIAETFSYLAAQAIANARAHAATLDLAETDALTGLANRRKAEARLSTEIGRAHRTGKPFALISIDIDRFKEINDTHGHPVGDRVLQILAQILLEQVREVDLAARVGGEEFLLVLPGTDSGSGAGLVAERVRSAVADAAVKLPGGAELHFTVSEGVACFPACGESREILLEHVDQALYTAKRQGRNQSVFYRQMLARTLEHDPYQMSDLLNRSLENIGAIRTAIDSKSGFHDHSERVTHYAVELGHALNMQPDQIETLRAAAQLHDIGTIVIPDDLINSKEPLTEDDWKIIRRHPLLAAEILENVPALRHLAPIVRAHHERFDGSGYPDGLKGDAIPVLAQVMAVADRYCALTTTRPYRDALSPQSAREAIMQGAGTRFDSHIAQVFVNLAITEPPPAEGGNHLVTPPGKRNNLGPGC